MKKRILICTTVLRTVRAFLVPHIRHLQGLGYCVDVAGNKGPEELDQIADHVYDLPFQRNPFSMHNISASRALRKIVSQNEYDMIHFHTPVASAFGRWAVKRYRKRGTKILYTAHGFHFYRGAPLLNWLIYYPIEKWLAPYTDTLITINQEDYERAKRSLKAKRIEYIPGIGLDTARFHDTYIDKNAKRKELDIPGGAFVVLSVGELNQNKNHQTVIKAISEVRDQTVYYIICGTGELEQYLKKLAVSLGIEERVRLLGFRTDVDALYKAADVFVLPSYREGLPVALMEAMAAGLPVVCSHIRGNVDLIEDEKGGLINMPDDVQGFTSSIDRLIKDASLRERMSKENASRIKPYDIENVLKRMTDIYEDGGGGSEWIDM